MSIDTWKITKTDTDQPSLESANSVFTVANGYLALKGNLLEHRRGRYPTTIVSGVFDEANMIKSIPPSAHERRYLDDSKFDDPKPCGSVANLPNPLFVKVLIDGRELAFSRGTVSDFRQEYDLRTAVYTYAYDLTTADGRTTRIRMQRYADMNHVHCAAMRYEITPVNYSGRIDIRSGIDGTTRSNLQGDKQYAVEHRNGHDDGRCCMTAHSPARDIKTHIATAHRVKGECSRRVLLEDEVVYNEFAFEAKDGDTLTLDKFIVITSTEDERHNTAVDTHEELDRVMTSGWEALIASQKAWWDDTWQKMDVKIEGDDLAQQYMRFCLMSLMNSAPRHTDRLSVPCKLLTGEWYQGTVFYDTDLYIVPFYTFTFPEIARTCVNWRYEGLEPARKIARKYGYEGAKFAWQAGPYGDEELAPWYRFVHTNIHINGDVAYTLMKYVWATGDTKYLKERGVDMLVESARFYASRARMDKAGRYHLDDVSGPDEGHCESTDNYYTNYLARRTLLWAVETLESLDEAERWKVERRLSISSEELARWTEVANGLVFLLNEQTGVYEQYDGFYALKPIPPGFRESQKEWWFTVFPWQAIHQPDVVMAQTMFRQDVPLDIRRANWRFYRDLSMNFSSMSYVINSITAKDMGDMEDAYRQFIITAGEDLDESLTGRGDTADGLHGTATGGAWMAAVFGFGGVDLVGETLFVNPKLPEHWKSLSFRIIIRDMKLEFMITQDNVTIRVEGASDVPLKAIVCGQMHELMSGAVLRVGLCDA